MSKKRKLILILLVINLVLTACVLLPKGTAEPTEIIDTSTPTEIPATPTPTPDPKTLVLDAPADLLQLLEQWDGKYSFYINKATDIQTIEDLNGKGLFCNIWNIGMEAALDDMIKFQNAAGVEMNLEIGNNIPQFIDQLQEDKNRLGFLLTSEAAELQDNPSLKVVIFK